MPTYEYQCDGCEHNFDEFHTMTADPLKTCPKCGEDKLRRVFGTGAAIIFKGSGFYQTDYRSDSYKKAAEADKGTSTSSNGDSTSKDSKTESSKPDSGSKNNSGGEKSSKSDS